MATSRRRAQTPWACRPGLPAHRLTDAEIARLRQELVTAYAEGVARLARDRRAEIIREAEASVGLDDENRAGRLNAERPFLRWPPPGLEPGHGDRVWSGSTFTGLVNFLGLRLPGCLKGEHRVSARAYDRRGPIRDG